MIEYNNKYFNAIGYKNSCTQDMLYEMQSQQDKRTDMWAEQRKICGGYDERVSWNLNTFMAEQIFTWLNIYLDNADGFVDLTFYKFNIDGEELTEKDAILKALSNLEFYLKYQDSDNETEKECLSKIQEAFNIIGLIFPALWW